MAKSTDDKQGKSPKQHSSKAKAAAIDGDTYSEAETVARREATLKRMLATPPKPHKATKQKGRNAQPKSD